MLSLSLKDTNGAMESVILQQFHFKIHLILSWAAKQINLHLYCAVIIFESLHDNDIQQEK